MKTGQTRPFLGFTKKYSALPRVVWAEESKTGFRFEIGPSYDVVRTISQLVTHEESKTGLRFELGPSYDVVPTMSPLVTRGQPSCIFWGDIRCNFSSTN